MGGPVEGRNPSAMVMGRIAKYDGSGAGGSVMQVEAFNHGGYGRGMGGGGGDDVTAQVEEFIIQNGLDDKSAESLRNQSPEVQVAVLNLGPAEGRNPSAMVMGRLAKAGRGEI